MSAIRSLSGEKRTTFAHFETFRLWPISEVECASQQPAAGSCETTLTPINLTPAKSISCIRSWYVGIECNSIG